MITSLDANAKREVLAALERGCAQAIEVQEHLQRSMLRLPIPTVEMVNESAQRLLKCDMDALLAAFADSSFPSCWSDRDLATLRGVQSESLGNAFDVSSWLKVRVTDTDVARLVCKANRLAEHRCRIELLARFFALVGVRLDEVVWARHKNVRSVQILSFALTCIVRYKEFEWLEDQAHRLSRIEDRKYFERLKEGMKFMLHSLSSVSATDGVS